MHVISSGAFVSAESLLIFILSSLLFGLSLLLHFFIKQKRKKLLSFEEPAPLPRPLQPSFPEEKKPLIMPYKEYKRQHSSRVREIAIISRSKQPSAVRHLKHIAAEVKKHSQYICNFTEYYLPDSQHEITQLMQNILSKPYSLLFTYGAVATYNAKLLTNTLKKNTPIIFDGIRDTWWHTQQEQNHTQNMTGITGSSGWKIRIPLFVEAHPTMKSALLIFHGLLPDEEYTEVCSLFAQHHVNTTIIKPNSKKELVEQLAHHIEVVDTIINMRNSFASEMAPSITKLCGEYKKVFLSAMLSDIHSGASVAISSTHSEIVTFVLVQKFINILDKNHAPHEEPIYNISTDHNYEIRFNKEAMLKQGLNPSKVVDIALTRGKLIYTIAGGPNEASNNTYLYND